MNNFTKVPQTTEENDQVLNRFNDMFTGEHD